MALKRIADRASLATLAGLAPHYLCFVLGWSPLWTETIAEWIMARTPSVYALWILDHLGAWAKPFAMTGGLAALGFGVFCAAVFGRRWSLLVGVALAALYGWGFGYGSLIGQISFWTPALAMLLVQRKPGVVRTSSGATRREALVMAAGTVLVAGESWAREQRAARRAVATKDLVPFVPPADTFAPALTRQPVTPVGTFYAMSKNTVDPAPDASAWRLKITAGDRVVRIASYAELMAMPMVSEYVTLRCVSNTLQSDLMGTALWTGVRLRQLIDRAALPGGAVEGAVIGVDGHGDSFWLDYLFSDDVMLALGMNGKTLNRTHGFPVRLIVPRYYGFKNVKWIGEISFVERPYIGTWPKMGYTKEPLIHTASHIDRFVREAGTLRVGGVSFAGDRGIQRVQVRAGAGTWVEARLEKPLSRFTWTRWVAALEDGGAPSVEARAMDGAENWQAETEGPLFPDGVKGPTVRRLT